MFALLRQDGFRRFVLAVTLATFVPVVSAAAACSTVCAFRNHNDTSSLTVLSVNHVGHADALAVPAAEHLRHGGPCHLAAVPFVAQGYPPANAATIDWNWGGSAEVRYSSFIPSPPEHRPRI